MDPVKGSFINKQMYPSDLEFMIYYMPSIANEHSSKRETQKGYLAFKYKYTKNIRRWAIGIEAI